VRIRVDVSPTHILYCTRGLLCVSLGKNEEKRASLEIFSVISLLDFHVYCELEEGGRDKIVVNSHLNLSKRVFEKSETAPFFDNKKIANMERDKVQL
jgi:hypothetical protein